jgi:hypothetical protein
MKRKVAKNAKEDKDVIRTYGNECKSHKDELEDKKTKTVQKIILLLF